ncbi:hypothetical protein GCM10018783_68130 [Streptomyces griseosporeus]|nr:hypothetical protein GCM10018783_68130 [Streptomyces griseosporeus]
MHGEPGFGGQWSAGGRLERRVAGEPAGDHGGGPGTHHGGDGSGRRSDSAHPSSVPAERFTGQWEAGGE